MSIFNHAHAYVKRYKITWFYIVVFLSLLVILGVAIPIFSKSASSIPPPLTFRGNLVGPGQGIEFKQVNFHFGSAEFSETGWGKIMVEPKLLSDSTGHSVGYVNVVTERGWVIQNLRIQSSPQNDYPRRVRRIRTRLGRIESVMPEVLPMVSTYFDLGVPDECLLEQSQGRELKAKVLYTKDPIGSAYALGRKVGRYSAQAFPVLTMAVNAEGDLGEEEEDDLPTSIGPPPPAGLPVIGGSSRLPRSSWFVLPNPISVETAKNQCVPMGHANNLQFLETTYGFSYNFSIPQPHQPGLGLINPLPGDDPEGDGTLVGRLDTQMSREIISRSAGRTVSRDNQIKGFFGYLSLFTDTDRLEIKHQGGRENYSEYGITSVRQGVKPTWDWICQEIQQGHGVVMSFGRYEKGFFFVPETNSYKVEKRTGGHMVRIYGCGMVFGIPRIATLDDGRQSNDADGLQSLNWWVVDTDGDGMLNLSGLNWEIEFVMSVMVLPPGIGI